MTYSQSPAGWLPVHRDQLRTQRSVTSIESLYLLKHQVTTITCQTSSWWVCWRQLWRQDTRPSRGVPWCGWGGALYRRPTEWSTSLTLQSLLRYHLGCTRSICCNPRNPAHRPAVFSRLTSGHSHLAKGRIACRSVIEDWMIHFAAWRYWLRFFSSHGINPVRDEITRTRLICFGVKERCKQFRSVYLDVAKFTQCLIK